MPQDGVALIINHLELTYAGESAMVSINEVTRVESLLLLVGLLDNNQEEMLVGSNEDLLSLRAHSEESHIVHGVDVTDDGACLHGQIRDMVSDVLGRWRSSRLVSLSNDPALVIDNQKSTHTLVVTDSVDPLFEISHFKFTVTIIM